MEAHEMVKTETHTKGEEGIKWKGMEW